MQPVGQERPAGLSAACSGLRLRIHQPGSFLPFRVVVLPVSDHHAGFPGFEVEVLEAGRPGLAHGLDFGPVGFTLAMRFGDGLHKTARVENLDLAVPPDDDGLELFVPHDTADAGPSGSLGRIDQNRGPPDPVLAGRTDGGNLDPLIAELLPEEVLRLVGHLPESPGGIADLGPAVGDEEVHWTVRFRGDSG